MISDGKLCTVLKVKEMKDRTSNTPIATTASPCHPAGVLPGVQRGMELGPGPGTAQKLPHVAAKCIEIMLLMDSKLHREIIVVCGGLVNAWLGLEVAWTISSKATCFEMEMFC